jgi:hypothetical protein
MIKLRRLASLIVCGCLAWTVPAAADAVTDWNAIALPAVAAGRPGPGPSGILDLALVQAAVHDAVQAIDGRFQPYHVKISGASGSPAAAAAAAAYNVLVGFYPSQAGSLTTTYQTYLSSNNLVNDPGLAVGKVVADGILPLRRLDPNPSLQAARTRANGAPQSRSLGHHPGHHRLLRQWRLLGSAHSSLSR